MASSLKQMVTEANAAVPKIAAAGAVELVAGGTMVLDVRDGPEVEVNGKAEGAVHVSHGMLEFRADPESPAFLDAFAKAQTILVYCAYGDRAALASKTLKDLGYQDVRNLGGFKDWVEASGGVERPLEPGM